MAISRSEAQSMFNYLGINLDNNEVDCFKCGHPLYYSNSRYTCINNHLFTYQDTAWKFVLHLHDLKKEVEASHTCGVQMGV